MRKFRFLSSVFILLSSLRLLHSLHLILCSSESAISAGETKFNPENEPPCPQLEFKMAFLLRFFVITS